MGEDEAECIEGVGIFKYLGRLMDRSDDNWLAFRKIPGRRAKSGEI